MDLIRSTPYNFVSPSLTTRNWVIHHIIPSLFCFPSCIMASVRSIASKQSWNAHLRRACHYSSSRCYSSINTSTHASVPAYRRLAARKLECLSSIQSKRSYASTKEEKSSSQSSGVVNIKLAFMSTPVQLTVN